MIVVVVDGQATPRLVSLGGTDGVRTEVVSGLEEGDEVLVEVPSGDTSVADLLESFRSSQGLRPPEGFVPGSGRGGFFLKK